MTSEIERAADALHHLDAGCARDEWVRAGMAAKSAGLDFDDFNNWSASGGNYAGENECRTVWKSFAESGAVTPATLFGMAFSQGWKDPSKSRAKGTRPSPHPASTQQTPPKPVKQAARLSPDEVWERGIPATPAEAYIHRKQGKPGGVRVYPASAEKLTIAGENVAGYLVVPSYAPDGVTLRTLQFIPPDKGKKLNLPGAPMDGFFTVGEVTDRAYIVEGIGTAWAINHATGAAAVVCFGAGNMAKVAKVLCDKFPAARLVIVPDKGQESKAATIAADVAGQWVAMPADKPGNYDANDFAAEYGSEALAALLDGPQAPPKRFNLLSAADLCNTKPMRWMVRGVLPADGLAALYGSSGSGKSFLILDMGCAVAGGADWFGRRVTQSPVTYVCLEGEAGIGKRVKAWSLHNNAPVPDALRFSKDPFDLLSDDVGELAKEIIAEGGAGGMVILDTLNRAAPGADENSSVDMGNIIAAAKQLQSLTGGLVLLVHHTGKDATKGLRGHSSLYAALDGAIEVTATDTRKAWSVAKCKDDVTGDAHPFKLEVVPIGTDDAGDEITSCVIVPDETGEAFKAKRITLGANQKIARDVLGEPLRKSPHTGKEGAPVGRPCIDYTEAVELVAERMPTDAKHRKSRAISAIGGLVSKGYMGMKGDWLWDN